MRLSPRPLIVWTLAVLTLVAAVGSGQQTPPGSQRRGAAPLVLDDHDGFVSIFDGATLKGWDGDPAFWKAENGALVGQSTRENPVKENTFLIWRGGRPRDFELKAEFRISSTNSGIQFRSTHLPANTGTGNNRVQGNWVLKGYQADIDFNNQWTGQIYEERGRGFLAMRGQAVYVPEAGTPKTIGNLQQTPDELKALIKTNDWNQVHLIVRGNILIQILNGAVTSLVVDDDVKNRAMEGLIGFQIHVGDPMKAEYRDIWLKEVPRVSTAAVDTDVERQLADLRRRVRDWGGLTRYGSDNAELGPPTVGDQRVVFIGDDLTERWAGGVKFFPGKPYVNRGIAGQTTAQMLVRFRQDVIALKPKVVVIQGGSNDIAGIVGPGTEGTVSDNLRSMTELAKANGIQVVLASATPVCDCFEQDQTPLRPQGKIIGLNGAIRDAAAASGAVYLDYYGALVNGRDFKKELTADGFLPNDAGYAVMAPLAEQAIRRALKEAK
jgi:lysophospholipase L1-like esterase